jgi:hypothetical protein
MVEKLLLQWNLELVVMTVTLTDNNKEYNESPIISLGLCTMTKLIIHLNCNVTWYFHFHSINVSIYDDAECCISAHFFLYIV